MLGTPIDWSFPGPGRDRADRGGGAPVRRLERQLRDVDGVPVLVLRGDLAGPSARRVAAAIRSLGRAGRGVVVNLAGLELVDSLGLEALLRWTGPGLLFLAEASPPLAAELRQRPLPPGVRLVERESGALRALGAAAGPGRLVERRRHPRSPCDLEAALWHPTSAGEPCRARAVATDLSLGGALLERLDCPHRHEELVAELRAGRELSLAALSPLRVRVARLAPGPADLAIGVAFEALSPAATRRLAAELTPEHGGPGPAESP